MTENRHHMGPSSPVPEDEAPDLTESPWSERLAAAPVLRGRPKSQQTKVSTTIRLDADVLEQFRAQGPGWQSRINQALRDWLSKN